MALSMKIIQTKLIKFLIQMVRIMKILTNKKMNQAVRQKTIIIQIPMIKQVKTMAQEGILIKTKPKVKMKIHSKAKLLIIKMRPDKIHIWTKMWIQ